MIIDDNLIEYLQGLAKIRLTPEQAEAAKEDLSAILAYMDALNELDTEGVQPMTHPLPRANVFRTDSLQPSAPREDITANAPKVKDGFIVVPKTVE